MAAFEPPTSAGPHFASASTPDVGGPVVLPRYVDVLPPFPVALGVAFFLRRPAKHSKAVHFGVAIGRIAGCAKSADARH
eukprot:4033402-Lingulodinium_polyedra.AAC.1